MLIPFVLDHEGLSEGFIDKGWSLTTSKAMHQNFLRAWHDFGLLVLSAGSGGIENLRAAINQLPPSIKTLWFETLKHYQPEQFSFMWDGNVSNDALEVLSEYAKAAVVEDTKAEVLFDFAEEQQEKIVIPLEDVRFTICRFSAVSSINLFAYAKELSGKHILPGDTYQDIWDTRFRSLARSSVKHVAIVDRYAISQHFFSSQGSLSGLARFLRLLDKDTQVNRRVVSLYSSWTPELNKKKVTFEEIVQDLREILSKLANRKITRINLFMALSTTFRDEGHDRFIRFGDNYVWELGQGLSVFEGAASNVTCSATFKGRDCIDGSKRIENEISSSSGVKTEKIQ